MLKSNSRQQRDPNNPKAKVTATGALRVDVPSLIQTPRVQAHLKAAKKMSNLKKAG